MISKQAFYWLFICLVFVCLGCSPKLIQLSNLNEQVFEKYPDWDNWKNHPKQIILPWVPREIRVAVHYFDTADSSHHWDHDFAKEYAKILISSTNSHLARNAKMNLPDKNKTKVLSTKINLQLDVQSIYFHYSDEDCFFIKKGAKANRYDRKMPKRYAVGSDTILNIFIMPFDPNEMKMGRQKLENTGIALGSTIKLAGLYEEGKAAWDYAGLLAHEVGHVLGLRHTWNGGDGCEDTPHNSNCWNTTSSPPCDGLTSNNLMDYNATQAAITPCQIAKMHANLSNPVHSASRLAKPLDSDINSIRDWIIQDHQKWSGAVSVPGNIIIEKEGSLYLSSYLSLASAAKIVIKKGGKLLLDNALIMERGRENGVSLVVKRGGYVYKRNAMTILSNNPFHSD